MPDQLFIVGALQQRVRDAEDDQLGLADTCMHQRIDTADVAVDHVHAAVSQGPEHQRIEIDHGDLLENRRTAPIDLAQQRAGGAEETENDDAARLPVPALVTSISIMLVIEIAQADPLQGTDQAAGDLVAAAHDEGAQDRQHHEGERGRARRLGADMARRNAGLDHDQRKFRDLRQIDRRQQARPQALLHQIERRERRHHAADDRKRRDHQRQPDHRRARNRDRHAERDKEQRDEEVAQRGHLGGDIEGIGECRQRDARHQ